MSSDVIRRTISLFAGSPGTNRDPRAALDIEAHLCLPIGCIRAMAGETLVGENRPDVAIELDRGRERDLVRDTK